MWLLKSVISPLIKQLYLSAVPIPRNFAEVGEKKQVGGRPGKDPDIETDVGVSFLRLDLRQLQQWDWGTLRVPGTCPGPNVPTGGAEPLETSRKGRLWNMEAGPFKKARE